MMHVASSLFFILVAGGALGVMFQTTRTRIPMIIHALRGEPQHRGCPVMATTTPNHGQFP